MGPVSLCEKVHSAITVSVGRSGASVEQDDVDGRSGADAEHGAAAEDQVDADKSAADPVRPRRRSAWPAAGAPVLGLRRL
ncbi:hypothetical protein GCM10018966_071160 [Streptomyces yanii]